MGEWPTFQGDATRRANTPAPSIRDPELKWKTRLGIQSRYQSPIIAGDYVFVGSAGDLSGKSDVSDGVYALEKASGKIAWFQPTHADTTFVAYADCLVFSVANDGVIRAHAADTGEVKWQHAFKEAKFFAPPVVLGRTLLTVDDHGIVRAFELSEGRALWTRDLGRPVSAGMASDGERVVVVSRTGHIFALNLSDGAIAWSVEHQGSLEATPTIVGSHVLIGFVSDQNQGGIHLDSYDLQSGQVLWRGRNERGYITGMRDIVSSPAVAENFALFGVSGAGRVIAASLETGRIEWSAISGSCRKHQYASPVVATDLVYVPRDDGFLHAVEIQSGTYEWAMWLGDSESAGEERPRGAYQGGCPELTPEASGLRSTPAIDADGTVYVGSREGFLYAVGQRTPDPQKP